MPKPVRLPVTAGLYGCPRCQVRRAKQRSQPRHDIHTRWTSSAAKSDPIAGYFPPASEIKHPGYAHLQDRSVIRLQGLDVVAFLNGLLPARLQPLPKNSTPIFTTFLSAKGRILYETFIYPPVASDSEGPWYIDVDTKSASAVFSHLKKHKLRSKFKLEKVAPDQLSVFYIWPGGNQAIQDQAELGGQDPRPCMGTRFLSNVSNPSSILSTIKEMGTCLSLNDYHTHRILSGHAEGSNELISGSALPQESNVDFDGGIDFHKGCYLGQELTIRTHHTGVVRKRILPCQVYSNDHDLSASQATPIFDSAISVPQPPREANISKMRAKGRSGRSTGKWLGGVGNVGLALCRLEMMTDIQLTAEGTNFDPEGEFSIVWEEGEADADGKTIMREVKIKPFVPQWVRDNIQAGIQSRSDRSKRRRQEDDEDDEEVD